MPGTRPGMTWMGLSSLRRSHPLHLDIHRRALGDGLIHYAIALGELEQLVELVLRRIGFDIEAEPDLAEPDRGLLVDAERAAKIQIALGRDRAGLERDGER